MKKVLWIDDSPRDLEYIVVPVVKNLWEKGIKSYMYIFGDFEKENSNRTDLEFNKLIDHLNEVISSKFINYLIENDFINNNDKIKEKYILINNDKDESNNNGGESKKISQVTSDVARIDIDGVSISNDILESWKKIDEKIFSITNDSGKEQLDYSKIFDNLKDKELIGDKIDKIIESIKKESYDAVFIDMCLLKDDYTKLMNKSTEEYKYNFMIPIFSMALYNAAKKNDLKAYMYTSFTIDDKLVKYWKEAYNCIFSQVKNDAEKKESDEIDFYNRKGKNVKNGEKLYEKVIKDLGV